MSSKKENYWIPLADLMTVLMVIFLFMAISYMVDINKKQKIQNQRQKDENQIFKEYEKTRFTLYKELDSTFKDDMNLWHLQLEKDLSIKFTNPQVLFSEGKADITPYFQKILSEFFPKYLRVLLQDKYKNKIAEIRIEGHTDNKAFIEDDDPYIGNMGLSQNRARNVLAYLRKQECFRGLDSVKKGFLQYLLTANGLSFGRTLDSNSNLSIFSKHPIDNDLSRRVEFKIVTVSDSVIEQAIKKMNE